MTVLPEVPEPLGGGAGGEYRMGGARSGSAGADVTVREVPEPLGGGAGGEYRMGGARFGCAGADVM